MSNHLGQIYSTTKNAEKYIVLNSQNVELSGNVKLTNGNLDVSQNLIFNNFSVTDKINFRENSGSTSYNIINNSLTANNDASLNNVDICGTIKLPDSSNNGYGNTGELLTSRGANNTPHWTTPTSTNTAFRATSPVATGFTFTGGTPLFSAQLENVIGNKGSFNIGGAYNPATGLFTAPETGVYSFTGSVFWETSSFVANYVRVMITTPTLITHANALIGNQYGANETFNANFTQVVTGIVSLTAGDTIGIYVNANNASVTNVAKISRQYSYFCGHKL